MIVRRLWAFLGILAVVVAGAWFAWPAPVLLDLAQVEAGPMEVTVDDEAKTRVRHVYTISAPVTGVVLRISHPAEAHATSLHVGDAVEAGETVVATMRPVAPGLLDIRSREEQQFAVAAAEATVRLSEGELRRIQAALDFAKSELQRASALARTDAISARNLDKAQFEVSTSEAALVSARAQLEVRRNELALAQARLVDPTTSAPAGEQSCCVQVRSPVTGRILRIIQESENTIAAGTPILEVGDTRDLEVVADLLSTEAVQVRRGADVSIDGWGGKVLRGRVVRVDPAGFTKVSALGIEEQRVQTVIELVDPPELWKELGHDYRVIVHVSVWRAQNATSVPLSALFRSGGEWAVFTVRDGRAVLTNIRIGTRNSRVAEVVSGLAPGDTVILHPSDRVRDKTRVAARPL